MFGYVWRGEVMSEDDAVALSMLATVPVCSSLRWDHCGVGDLWRTISLSQQSEKLSVLAVLVRLHLHRAVVLTAEGASVFSFRPTGPQ